MTGIGLRDPAAGADPGLAFWRGVLLAGGFTSLPRLTRDPAPGVADEEVELPAELVRALRRLAGELEVPLTSLLLAAHAKVLSLLSGEEEVITGYAVSDTGRPVPCRLTSAPESWRAMAVQADRAAQQVLSHAEFPVDELARELGASWPLSEAVFDPTGAGSERLPAEAAVCVGVVERGPVVLRVGYRTDVLDAPSAARIAGYHLSALTLMTADPEAEHARQTLLSAEEFHFQLHGLAGPERELPDKRVHELFEERARAHPDAVVAVHRQTELTYGELNARANRLARALSARGLRREGVVAVVTERNLDWMTAVVAIFKAGGAYLPIEPHFPPERISRMLSQAGCGLVLTESTSTATLEVALDSLPGVESLLVEAGCEEDHASDDLGVAVTADQLAYLYFTSGSTGEPKGAMCEHAGMLNHVYAKIDDLGVGERQVVAQTAPQCFDISLWQLISAPLVGGRTLLVEQEVIMDAERFVDKLVEARVAVVQVVPSYLEAVLSYLEKRPRELPALRCVSVTGEALKKELAQRWFAAQPGIKLVNAYGLTETSDDTNHEVMERVPDLERIPLGRPVNNVHVYVVDATLAPVPFGAPGEIVFSGVCVGRGYVNDPERTRRAFLPDPHREGERLYRSGDHGRWLPDGRLDFLGRRDTQVKIRGFRIEIGEIENALLGSAGVRDGAVVVTERADGGKELAAFYTGPRPLDPGAVRARLAESLPKYMIPPAFHWRQSLPLTGNGKIDRKALVALAGELVVVDQDFEGPTTETEQRVAAAWARVLGIPPDQIGRLDHFFDRGGTSLSAVKLAVALDRAVSIKDITGQPVLADLAALIDGGSNRSQRLLQRLSESERGEAGALVCFPYAGGNAVNFRSLATALSDTGLVVYGVELPGHDLAARREPFAPLTEIVEQVIAELMQRERTRLMLWGHSAGAALAVEAARKLEAQGAPVERVFVGAQLLGDARGRRNGVAELEQCSDAEIAERLSGDGGYSELGELDAQRAEHVGAAFRHDYVTSNSYLADALETPPAVKLSAGLTVVAAADDPVTAGFGERHRDWQLLAETVEPHELPDGGHYFVRTRPAEAAGAVRSALRAIPVAAGN